ncbi:MAG: spore coat associated protein CotJA [Christensenellales bacterium]|jgi:hypothetical protein
MILDNDPDMYASEQMCIPQETTIKNVQLAHAYVPFQKLCTTYTPMRALEEGTAFPEFGNSYAWESK